MEQLQIQVQNHLENAFGIENKAVDTLVKDVYKNGYYNTAYEIQKGFNTGFNISGVDTKKLDDIAHKPWTVDSRTFSDRIWERKDKMVNQLHQEMIRNCIYGRSQKDMMNALTQYVQKDIKNAKYCAARVVRTETAYFSSISQRDSLVALGCERYEIDLPLTSNSCPICTEMNGKIFKMSEFEVGSTAPPFHPNCENGDILPYFDDEFGVDEQNVQAIPDDLPYEEWEKKFVKPEKGLTEGKKGDIISKKPITPITDNTIEKIPRVDIEGYTSEQCKFIQEQHKELLKYSRDKNGGNEVAFVFRKELNDKSVFLGSDDSINIGSALFNKGSDLFVMHNHPRNGSYSANDIIFFLSNDNVKHLSIVKNNGYVEILTKLALLDITILKRDFERLIKKYVKTGNDKEYSLAVRKLLEKYSQVGGMLEWKK